MSDKSKKGKSKLSSKVIDFSKFDSKKLLQNQVTRVGAGAIGLMIAGLIFMNVTGGEEEDVAVATTGDVAVKIQTSSQVLDDDKTWRFLVEEKIETQHADINLQFSKMREILEFAQSNFKAQLGESERKSQQELLKSDKDYQEKMRFLQAALEESKNDKLGNFQGGGSQEQSGEVVVTKFAVSKKFDGFQKKDPKNYIPAGSFTKAVLLHGMDASTSLGASSDPEPMTIEILDNGALPNNFKSHLKQCRIVASAYGNLSSERVKIRLERLSCIDTETESSVEANIAGYIVGGDARIGTRGEVISKDGQFIARSLGGGLLSGLSHAGQKTSNAPLFVSGDSKEKSPTFKQNLGNGLLSGASNSMDRVAEYYIDKAEQVQPVIDIDGGRLVTVFFTKGAYIKDIELQEDVDMANMKEGDKES